MAGKIFSSRIETTTDVEELQGLVFVAHEILNKDEEPAEDSALLMAQLDSAIMGIAEKVEMLTHTTHLLSMDVIQLSLQSVVLVREMKLYHKIMTALNAPVNNGAAFTKALSILQREGMPHVSSSYGNVDVQLSFTEDKLAEALRLAISEYNAQTTEDAAN